MRKNIVLIIFLVFSSSAWSTPKSMVEREGYQESLKLLKRFGREEIIKNLVKVQRDQIDKFGGELDSYTNVVGIQGDDVGVTQTVILKVAEMLSDINPLLESKGKDKLTKESFSLFLYEGGYIYQQQVMMLCSKPSTRALIDRNIVYSSKYYDNKMRYITEISVDKSVCLKND
ncbi:hypothetical protein [Photobacterium kagoshimensis]|uniref:hypothetical protein n=1 Tax=Photobacterium kagoshimensis TaxID=2910242 RepID=UPI003D0F564C